MCMWLWLCKNYKCRTSVLLYCMLTTYYPLLYLFYELDFNRKEYCETMNCPTEEFNYTARFMMFN